MELKSVTVFVKFNLNISEQKMNMSPNLNMQMNLRDDICCDVEQLRNMLTWYLPKHAHSDT